MLTITNTEVYGFEAAIRGMRNPKESWSKSDSYWYTEDGPENMMYILGENDLHLAKTLCNAGPVHGKFSRMIHVSCDITAPLYWWKEADTYKVGTVADSCSTMYKVHAHEFTTDMFSCEHLRDGSLAALKVTIQQLNLCRDRYLESKNKDDWWQMIQLLPSSFNQTRTWDANYQVLQNIYHYRKDHRLDEWHQFCKWIESLPYAEELIICSGEDKQ